MPEGLTDRQWKWILLRHPLRQQLWRATGPGGMRQCCRGSP